MSFQVQKTDAYLMIRTDYAVLTEKEAKQLDVILKAHPDKLELVIFDFSTIDDFTPQGLRQVTLCLSGLSQNETKTGFLLDKKIIAKVKAAGLDRIIHCYHSVEEILPNAGSVSTAARASDFLNTTLDAVVFTMGVSANNKSEPGKPFMRAENNAPAFDVAATVGLVSAEFQGSMILLMPKQTYLNVMGRMAGDSFTEITPEIRDGIAELLNVILGQAKTSLNDRGFEIKQAIPTLIQGGQINLLSAPATRSIVVPFSSECGEFSVQITTNAGSGA